MEQKLIAGLVALALAGPAQAILIDSAGDTGVLNGTVGGNAIVIGIDGNVLQGVGNSKVFLTIQGAGTERGYNTVGATQFDTTASGTTALLTSDAPFAVNGGVNYREFAYSLNQQGGDPTIGINRILLFQTNDGAVTGFNDGATPNIGNNTNLIFAWSAALSGQTLTVQDFVSGQSNVEMLLLVRAQDFNPLLSNLVLYVEQTNSNDGPDKWIVFGRAACIDVGNCTTAVPEPQSAALLGLGLGVLGWVARRKSHKA